MEQQVVDAHRLGALEAVAGGNDAEVHLQALEVGSHLVGEGGVERVLDDRVAVGGHPFDVDVEVPDRFHGLQFRPAPVVACRPRPC